MSGGGHYKLTTGQLKEILRIGEERAHAYREYLYHRRKAAHFLAESRSRSCQLVADRLGVSKTTVSEVQRKAGWGLGKGHG